MELKNEYSSKASYLSSPPNLNYVCSFGELSRETKLLLAGVRKWCNPSRVLLDWQEKAEAVA